MKTWKTLALALSAAALCLQAAATDVKIAIIDMEKVFQDYYKTRIQDAT
jgi:Skp family chaperone for outer membrane proteins